MKEISASLLSFYGKDCDMDKNIKLLNNSKVDFIHLDVMDGKFVDNKFLSKTELVKVIEKINKKIDIHFMVNDPITYIEKIKLFDINNITVHYEIKKLDQVIEYIKSLGIKVGVAISPETDIENIFQYLDKINIVLVMSVKPGKAGQDFIPTSYEKIIKLREEINKRNLSTIIEVDGGVCKRVFDKVKDADRVVLGTCLIDKLDEIDNIKEELI